MSLTRSFRLVTRHIERRFRRELRAELRLNRAVRSPTMAHDAPHVDVVLYTFNPHRCKGIDMAFLQRLTRQVSIVPVLTKADTMTVDELTRFRREVADALKAADIRVAHAPFAVICADKECQDAKAVRGRTYPWGVARSEDDDHSELPALRRFLLTDGLLALKQASLANYERYRRRTLWRQRLRRTAALALSLLSLDARPRAWLLARVAAMARAACGLFPAVPSVQVTWHARPKPSPPPQPTRRRLFELKLALPNHGSEK
jgi:septin 7